MSGATASSLKELSRTKVWGGWLIKCSHDSTSTSSPMKFNIYLPPSVPAPSSLPAPSSTSASARCPSLYFLSGLTCTEDNFMQKAGAFAKARECNVALVAPDTSPRQPSTLQRCPALHFPAATIDWATDEWRLCLRA